MDVVYLPLKRRKIVVLYFNEYTYQKTCAALSVLIHGIILCALFLSFVLLQHKKRKEALAKKLQPALNQHLPTSISAPVFSASVTCPLTKSA